MDAKYVSCSAIHKIAPHHNCFKHQMTDIASSTTIYSVETIFILYSEKEKKSKTNA